MLPKSSTIRDTRNTYGFKMYPSKDFSFIEKEEEEEKKKEEIQDIDYVNEELDKLNVDIDKLLEDITSEDPITKKSYVYNVLENLDTNLNYSELYYHDIQSVNICSYHINVEGNVPFIQYFLFKNSDEKDFSFPSFPYSNDLDIMMKSLSILEVLYMSYSKKTCYSYKGFKLYNKNLYLFFDCSTMNVGSVRMDKNNDLWLVLIDEIINKRYVCQYGIKKEVTDFFLENHDFLYLNDCESDEIYETPTVVYSSCKDSRFHFHNVFGISPENNEMNLFGNYYYFRDFDTIVREKTDNYGLIRLAIFLNKTLVKMNLPDDPIDNSEITNHLLAKFWLSESKEEKELFNQIKMTLRISDREAKWTEIYDSIYVGPLELDDGKYLEKTPLWVVKDYSQQLVLSCHLLDKTNCCIK